MVRIESFVLGLILKKKLNESAYIGYVIPAQGFL